MAGTVNYYFTTPAWLIVAGMLQCMNHLKIDQPGMLYSSKKIGLNRKFEIFLLLCPLVILVVPLSRDRSQNHDDIFVKRFNWCGTDVTQSEGKWVVVHMMTFLACMCFELYRAWSVCASCCCGSRPTRTSCLLARSCTGWPRVL